MLGLEAAPLKLNTEIVEAATDLVEERASMRIWDALSGEAQAAFATAIEDDDHDAVADTLEKNGVDLSKILSEEIETVKEEMSRLAKENEVAYVSLG